MSDGFKKGELIASEKPFVYVLWNDARGLYCDYCIKQNISVRFCTGCKFVKYCDQNCQKLAWPEHKQECKYMHKLCNMPPLLDTRIDSLILMTRVLFKLKEPKVSKKIGNYSRTFDDIESHFEELSVQKESNNAMYKLLKSMLGEIAYSEEEIIKISGKISVSVFAIYDPWTGIPMANGLYLGASIFQHSCDPNCVWIFRGTEIYVRALKDTSTKDVKKLFVNYCEVHQMQKRRAEQMKERFWFTCTCDRCTKPQFEEYVTSTEDEDMANALLYATDYTLFHEAGSVFDRNLDKDLEVLTHCLKMQEGVIPDSHYRRLPLLVRAMELSRLLSRNNEALKYALKILDPLKTVWGDLGPLVVTFEFKIAQLYMLTENIEEGKKMSQKAYKSACILYGEDHEFSQSIRDLCDMAWSIRNRK